METVGFLGVVIGIVSRFWPVWIALAVVLALIFATSGGSAFWAICSTAWSASPAW